MSQSRSDNRARMPLCTDFIDSIREAMGADQVKFIKATENGHSIEWGERQVIGEGVMASESGRARKKG